MFECIRCNRKPTAEDKEDEEVGQSKEAVKSLTAQIKDIVLKFTGASCKRSGSYRKGPRSSPKSVENSEGVRYPYMGGVTSGSTPPWELGGNYSNGNQTPRVQEPVVVEPEAVAEEEIGNKVWVAQVEPGVDVTFVSLPGGGNDLKRIRFNREMFDKWQAQVWWGENYDRIRELYNVQRFNRQALNTPTPSEDEQKDSSNPRNHQTARDSPVAAWLNNDSMPRNQYYSTSGFTTGQGSSSNQEMHAAGSSMEASRASSKDEQFFSNAVGIESEWIEQVEPGVFVTIRQLPDGNKELRRIRFSRERFGDEDARKWWEENRERVQVQYM
ncbi:unnamed protein product [Lathyrus sativus]|nr:unnamed protein product [Lathyrus sativus]